MKLVFLTWPTENISVTRTADNEETRFSIGDTKLYVAIGNLTGQYNAGLLQHQTTGFKRKINCNKLQAKPTI